MARLLGMLVVHGLGYFSRSLGSYTFIQIHEGEEIHYALWLLQYLLSRVVDVRHMFIIVRNYDHIEFKMS